jgi:hypothetical protein
MTTPGQIEQLQRQGIRVYCPPQNGAASSARAPETRRRLLRVRRRDELDRPEARRLYARRSASSEPTFHHIPLLLGFGRFSLRGLSRVNLEWNLGRPRL